jgi:hypothetical protein
MKKFLIYLSSFLLLFGVSVAFAGVYSENFNDGVLNPPLEADGEYEIVDGRFHMLNGYVQGDYIVGGIWARLENEFISKFEGETQMVADGFNLHPTIAYKNPDMHIELSFYGEFMDIPVHLYQTDGSVVTEYLEELTSGMLYYWSITAHQNHVTIEINNNTYEVFEGVFQKPSSVSVSWVQLRGITDVGSGYNVKYYADNLVVYTSPTSSFAVLEERDDPVFGVGAITYDSETGLEWLDITESSNKSFNYVSTQFGPGGEFEGFRHATLAEVEELWIHAGIPDIGDMSGAPTTANFEPISAFHDLFGYYVTISGYIHRTWGITANKHGCCQHYCSTAEINLFSDMGQAILRPAPFLDNIANSTFGHYLVRTASPNGVYVDIRPGICPSALDINSAEIIKTAILGTGDFDVSDIDPETIRLTRDGSQVAPLEWKFNDVATPYGGEPCNCHDLGKDGSGDLVLKFDAQDVIEQLDLGEHVGETIPLTIIGNLSDGVATPIEGQDCVWVKTEDRPVPNVEVSPSSGPRGTTFSLPGYGFTPNSTVTLHFIGPDGSHHSYLKGGTDSSGNYTHTFTSGPGTEVGRWEYYGVDDSTDTRSDSVYFRVKK